MTVAEVRKRTAEVMGDNLACAWCGAPTSWATLSTCGARCGRCFDAYKRTPQPQQHYDQAGEKPTPVEVMQRLVDRKSAGESLSKPQLEYIDAIRKKYRLDASA